METTRKMKSVKRMVVYVALVSLVVLFAALSTETTSALPEYAAQTGEPCGSCHISTSGGGLRTPRGQAWVAGGKGGTVPDINESLRILGVELSQDAGTFTDVPESIPEAVPPAVYPEAADGLWHRLSTYEGN